MKSIVFLLFSSVYAFSATLQDTEFFNYDVFFTNPVCEEYKYDEAVYSIRGKLLDSKPKNVYCKRGDFELNAKRESSPHFNIKKLIDDKNVNELFLTFLSFSNSDIADSVCEAIKRNTKVTFIIDSKNKTRPGSTRRLDEVSDCTPENVPAGTTVNKPKTLFRGNTGGLGYAHNKLIIANFKDSKKVTLVYGSANMSSGTILHHENWHFVTTSTETYFYEAHLCLRDGMLNAADSKSQYKKFISKCRNEIKYPKESDIDFFIVPSDGKEALAKILKFFKSADSIDMAAHRFTHTTIINAMREASENKKKVRLMTDDDIYWTGVLDENIGSNMFFEYNNVIKVVKSGVEVMYVQSNQNSKLLHHNKYIIFNDKDGVSAVHAGAGNFTKAAFSKNFENFYFIQIPSVIEKFKKQYQYALKNLATKYEDMPVQYVMP